jgi:hypothetical protein
MQEMRNNNTAAPPMTTLRLMRVTGCGRARSSIVSSAAFSGLGVPS